MADTDGKDRWAKIEKVVQDSLDEVIKWVKEAHQLVKNEVPQVVKEFLIWGAIQAWIGLILYAIAGGALVASGVYVAIHAYSGKSVWLMLLATCALPLGGWLLSFVYPLLLTALKVHYTPRIYLIGELEQWRKTWK